MSAEASEDLALESKGNSSFILLKHFVLFFVLMSIWQIANWSGADPLLFPSPIGIVESMVSIFVIKGTIWHHLGATFAKAMGGMVIGSLIGMGLAVSAALSATFRDYLKPYIVVIEAMPRIAVGPVFVALMGFGYGSAVALAALVCFFAPFINTLTGLLQVDEEAEELFRSLGATRRQIFFRLMIPNALPLIAAGLKLATAGAFAGALVAEFISANVGLGVMMGRYVHTLNMEFAFGTLFSITAFGYLLFRTMEAINYRAIYWHSEQLMQRRSRRQAAQWAPIVDAVTVNQSTPAVTVAGAAQ